MRVLFIQQCELEGPGLYAPFVEVAHEPYPALKDYDAFVIGGTPVAANERDLGYVRKIVATGRPCLGICCGAQMLARVLGGRVFTNPETEVGGYDVRLTAEGAADPLFAGFPEEFPVFHWHADAFTIPPGAQTLVAGDQCFRHGSTAGLLFHLEVTAPEAERWAGAYAAELPPSGKTGEQVVAECAARAATMRGLAFRLMDNFLSWAAR